MLSLLRNHGKKILTGLLLATTLGAGGVTAYQQHTSCCSAGMPCCQPGMPCCHGRAVAER